MKKVLKFFSILAFLFCMAFYANSNFLNASICTYCVVSSDTELNDGSCRESDTGDTCYSSGKGPDCEKNGSEECDPIE